MESQFQTHTHIHERTHTHTHTHTHVHAHTHAHTQLGTWARALKYTLGEQMAPVFSPPSAAVAVAVMMSPANAPLSPPPRAWGAWRPSDANGIWRRHIHSLLPPSFLPLFLVFSLLSRLLLSLLLLLFPFYVSPPPPPPLSLFLFISRSLSTQRDREPFTRSHPYTLGS